MSTTDRTYPNCFFSTRFVGVAVTLALIAIATVPAPAMESRPYSIEVLVDGVPVQEYVSRGRTFIEAREGREYSIRLANHTSRRVAVALAVDGLNSIDAKTTSMRDASKWVLGPHQTITIDGWQTDSSTARRFFFTTEPKSYGAWLGQTANLGIITAAVFREKRPVRAKVTRPQPGVAERPSARLDAAGGEGSGAQMESGKSSGRSSTNSATESERREADSSEDLAATGIGRKVDHGVRRIRFESEKTPAAVMDIRYEYHDALVRLGVLRPDRVQLEDPLDRRERARGFEDSDFAPDPYGY